MIVDQATVIYFTLDVMEFLDNVLYLNKNKSIFFFFERERESEKEIYRRVSVIVSSK